MPKNKESIDLVMEYLDRNIVNYRAVFTSISLQQRKLLAYICCLDKPENVNKICRECFLDPRSAATGLRVLKKKGILKFSTSGRDTYYEPVDPWLYLYMKVNGHQFPSDEDIERFVKLIPPQGQYEESDLSFSP